MLPPIKYGPLRKKANVGRFKITIAYDPNARRPRRWGWTIAAEEKRTTTGEVTHQAFFVHGSASNEDLARRAVRSRLVDHALSSLSRGLP